MCTAATNATPRPDPTRADPRLPLVGRFAALQHGVAISDATRPRRPRGRDRRGSRGRTPSARRREASLRSDHRRLRPRLGRTVVLHEREAPLGGVYGRAARLRPRLIPGFSPAAAVHVSPARTVLRIVPARGVALMAGPLVALLSAAAPLTPRAVALLPAVFASRPRALAPVLRTPILRPVVLRTAILGSAVLRAAVLRPTPQGSRRMRQGRLGGRADVPLAARTVTAGRPASPFFTVTAAAAAAAVAAIAAASTAAVALVPAVGIPGSAVLRVGDGAFAVAARTASVCPETPGTRPGGECLVGYNTKPPASWREWCGLRREAWRECCKGQTLNAPVRRPGLREQAASTRPQDVRLRTPLQSVAATMHNIKGSSLLRRSLHPADCEAHVESRKTDGRD